MMMTEERRREAGRATERAKAALKPGDRLRVRRCGGREVTVTFKCWDLLHPKWINSASLDDIHALHIVKVNGVKTGFSDDDMVERWHNGEGADRPLHEFLGMTWEEYGAWLKPAGTAAA